MTAPPATGPSFADPSAHPADTLSRAAAVIRFLAEVTPALNSDTPDNPGLSETGAHGLFLVLDTLENTISQAADRITS